MRTGRPKAELVLSKEEERDLRSLTRRSRTAPELARRARIILASARGLDNKTVARKLRVSQGMVGKWRSRFVERRMEGLDDEPRTGAPRQIGDDEIEKVITLTLESTPRGATHWSTRSMAKKSGLSPMTISRIWRTFGLQPHRTETFKLSPDPLFIEKVRDVVGLYVSPPQHAVVLCVDEKSQIQALERSQPLLPMSPGRAERRSHDYRRNGTTTLFAALDVKTGIVIGETHSRHRATEFRKFLNTIDANVPDDLDVHLILDNYATHKTQAIRKWLVQHPRFHFHFIPTYSSWLNMVERLFAELTNKTLRRANHTSVGDLEEDIREFIQVTNEEPKPYIWTKTADQILARVAAFAKRTHKLHS